MSPFFRDALERVLATYAQVFLGLLITSGVTDLSAVQAAALAAIPAALSALKAVIAKRFGDPDTAGF
jgi:hypothetical protein